MSPPLLAVVLSRRSVEVSPKAVMASLRERFEEISITPVPFRLEGKRGFALAMGGISVAVMFEDRPFDLGELKTWHGHLRDTDGPLLDNAAHVAVNSPFDAEGHEEMLPASLAILRVASVISDQPGAHAVLWSPAFSLTDAQTFRVEVAKASEHQVPVTVLARIGQFQVGTEGGKPLLGVWAMGLSRFIGREIEFVPKPLPAYQMLNALASATNWLLLKGPVFKDGDTCGVSATERIRVHHRDHGLIVQTPVLLMDIETMDPGATRFAN